MEHAQQRSAVPEKRPEIRVVASNPEVRAMSKPAETLVKKSGAEGIRTLDPHVANVVLSQLSYCPDRPRRSRAFSRDGFLA